MSEALDLLGGAQRIRPRVRGFVPWSPHADTRALLDQVRAVFEEYRDYLPLTIRQIFYRLVGKFEYAKTEQAYERLCEHLNRARRARIIPMDYIREDGGTVLAPTFFDSADDFLDNCRAWAEEFLLDRSTGQKTRLVVNCEAAGMAPQLERVAGPYGIAVMSSGGFESTTERYKFARELADHDRLTEVLDIGDHDPSGAHKYIAFCEDVEAFVRELGGEVTFTRLAVTPTQIVEFDLPTAPPKETDRRAFTVETCQAEAIAPDVLAAILRVVIEQRIDRAVYERVLRRERRVQRDLIRKLKDV
jgi:hypothetical protein